MRRIIILGILFLIIIIGGLFVYSKITGKTITEILPFFQEPVIKQSHLQTLVISGTTELCGDINNIYDKVVVTNTGILNICARNATAGTGFLNLTLGTAGNFTVYPGGFVNGTARGGAGGAGAITTNGTDGENGNNWTVGTANGRLPNGGGGGGGNRTTISNSAGGGGGGFGGGGGYGGVQPTTDNRGDGGLIYGQTDNLTLRGGSGGGGNNADAAAAGGKGGAGFKVNVGLGIINIQGFVNVSGFQGIIASGTDSAGGGGGSGGNIILYGSNITVTGAILNASGGSGGLAGAEGTDDCGGGGGGGGRIYLVYSTINNASTTTHVLAGGSTTAGCGLGADGAAGTAGTINHNNTAAMFTDAAPQWSLPMTNDSTPAAGASVNHSVKWTDDGELTYATLEVNGTGVGCNVAANVSSRVIVGTSNFSNLTWEIPAACSGKTIGWRIYAKDFPGNQTNVTDLQMYPVQAAAPDTCTYTSGNWAVNCADNCNITSNVALGGNNMTITGTGTFTTEANITQYTNLTIRGTDTSNKCIVRCFKGGCFRAA